MFSTKEMIDACGDGYTYYLDLIITHGVHVTH